MLTWSNFLEVSYMLYQYMIKLLINIANLNQIAIGTITNHFRITLPKQLKLRRAYMNFRFAETNLNYHVKLLEWFRIHIKIKENSIPTALGKLRDIRPYFVILSSATSDTKINRSHSTNIKTRECVKCCELFPIEKIL